MGTSLFHSPSLLSLFSRLAVLVLFVLASSFLTHTHSFFLLHLHAPLRPPPHLFTSFLSSLSLPSLSYYSFLLVFLLFPSQFPFFFLSSLSPVSLPSLFLPMLLLFTLSLLYFFSSNSSCLFILPQSSLLLLFYIFLPLCLSLHFVLPLISSSLYFLLSSHPHLPHA